MAGSMHWTSKFRTLKWLQRMLMCAKTLQKTLAVFPLAWLWKAVTSDSGTGETTSDEQQQVLLSALSLVSGCWSAHCLLSSGDGSTPFRAGHYWWPPWGSHVQCGRCVHCTLGQPCSECGSAHKVVDGASNQATCKASPPGFPLTPPPIEPVGWDAGRMGSKMRRRGLYLRSHIPLLSLPSGWAARFTLATTAQILNQKLMNCKFYGMLFRSLFSSSETCFEGELFIKWLVSLWFIARELPHLWPQPKVSNWKQIWFWVGEKSKVSQFRKSEFLEIYENVAGLSKQEHPTLRKLLFWRQPSGGTMIDESCMVRLAAAIKIAQRRLHITYMSHRRGPGKPRTSCVIQRPYPQHWNLCRGDNHWKLVQL